MDVLVAKTMILVVEMPTYLWCQIVIGVLPISKCLTTVKQNTQISLKYQSIANMSLSKYKENLWYK